MKRHSPHWLVCPLSCPVVGLPVRRPEWRRGESTRKQIQRSSSPAMFSRSPRSHNVALPVHNLPICSNLHLHKAVLIEGRLSGIGCPTVSVLSILGTPNGIHEKICRSTNLVAKIEIESLLRILELFEDDYNLWPTRKSWRSSRERSRKSLMTGTCDRPHKNAADSAPQWAIRKISPEGLRWQVWSLWGDKSQTPVDTQLVKQTGRITENNFCGCQFIIWRANLNSN